MSAQQYIYSQASTTFLNRNIYPPSYSKEDALLARMPPDPTASAETSPEFAASTTRHLAATSPAENYALRYTLNGTASHPVAIPGSTSPLSSLMSGPSSLSTVLSNYSVRSSRNRYYLSKSFDLEDDLEFCPDIPETGTSHVKKFNPYTASVFSPSQEFQHTSRPQSPPLSGVAPRAHTPHTPRTRKALEIVNPQTRMRVLSPSFPNK